LLNPQRLELLPGVLEGAAAQVVVRRSRTTLDGPLEVRDGLVEEGLPRLRGGSSRIDSRMTPDRPRMAWASMSDGSAARISVPSAMAPFSRARRSGIFISG